MGKTVVTLQGSEKSTANYNAASATYDPVANGAHCSLCPLKGAKVIPPAPAKKTLRLVVINEGPGRNEEHQGIPLAGKSASMLDVMLRKNGIASRADDCHTTNAALCRGDGGDKEQEKAAECCAPRLTRELASLPANVPILAMGKLSAKATLGVKTIMVARGFIWTAKEILTSHVKALYRVVERSKVPEKALLKADTAKGRASLAGRIVVPTVAPYFVLRSDTWNPILQLDVARACRIVRGEIRFPFEDNAPHSIGGPELFSKLGKVISLDVETDGINPVTCNLLCVGMSDGVNTIVMWPWVKQWVGPLTRFLRTRTSVVCHNGNYDRTVLEMHGVK